MTTDEQYVPSDEDMRWHYAVKRMDDGATRTHAEQEYTRWLAAHDARVRRDAAREAEARIEAVQHLIDQADEMGEWAITCTRLQRAIDGSNPQPGA